MAEQIAESFALAGKINLLFGNSREKKLEKVVRF